MPKQLLTGSLEEQCAFLYQMAHEKMQIGNYTGAIHALQEIVEHAPDYEDASTLLSVAKRRKTEQRNRLLFALIGAVLFIGVGTFSQVGNDLLLFGLAVLGLLAGYGTANLIGSLRS